MHDLGDALVRNGFAAPVLDVERVTLHYLDVRKVAADLKATGAHNATAGRPRGLTGRRKFAALQAAYEQFRQNGRLPATYEVVFAHAWAPAYSARRGARTNPPAFPWKKSSGNCAPAATRRNTRNRALTDASGTRP